jgi:putative nucleotidyltransferase with HDIG domain
MSDALELPILPVARMRAVAALSQRLADRDPIGQLVELANSDPELTAAVMRAANSAFSSPLTRIDNARAAIVRVGPAESRYRMLSAITRPIFDLEGAGLDADELWRHVVVVASITEGAAGQSFPSAFTVGLLHDIGRMAMAAQWPDRYQMVVASVRGGADPLAAEQEHFGTTHGEWGSRVARAWKLPDLIVTAIGQHHEPAAEGFAAVLQRAREVSARLGIGDGLSEGVDPAADEATMSLLQRWERRLQGDEWSARAIWRSGGLRALALRADLVPDDVA